MIVTLTDRDKTNFKIKFAVKDSKVISIPNWVENSLNLSKYDIFSKKIITVGRLERVKGYDKLIEVAKIVKMYHPDWKWDIFGNGSMYEELNEKIKKEELEDFLFLKGNTKNIENIYRQYSFFVMTSYYEGLPLVLLEAQMNSLPIISFDCPTGPSEIIDNDENGYLIKCYDVKQMANKIIDLIECEQIRKSFSIKSDKNLKKYSKQEVLKKWNDLIVSM